MSAFTCGRCRINHPCSEHPTPPVILELMSDLAAAREEIVQARREWDEAHAFIAKQNAEIESLTTRAKAAEDSAGEFFEDAKAARAEIEQLKQRINRMPTHDCVIDETHPVLRQLSDSIQHNHEIECRNGDLRALLGECKAAWLDHGYDENGDQCEMLAASDGFSPPDPCVCGYSDLIKRIDSALGAGGKGDGS